MSAFIGIIGFLAFFIGIIMLLINLFRKKPKKKSLILIVAGFILFVVGVSIPSNNQNKEAKDNTSTSVSSSSSSSKKEASTPKTSKPKQSSNTTQVKQVTFEQLVNAYKANGASADDSYKGKMLEFQGKVTKVTKAVFTGSDVTLDAGNFTENQFMNTTATINMPNDEAKKLTSGQTYTFQAKLNDATIMDSGWVQNLSFSKGTIK
ncbi:DUF3290 family protein [Lactococcus hircilactis]|uniref:DUF3290 family protein n=1 Tax=Lactococcus hircilactis TaxID=1494462 RepID=A0A7X2D0T1_9LACT|nr:DUF3290 family protein [Lactococcus hircilactis]MQW40284.1 DUF3290 family protein [Lactococcus hircilactis]